MIIKQPRWHKHGNFWHCAEYKGHKIDLRWLRKKLAVSIDEGEWIRHYGEFKLWEAKSKALVIVERFLEREREHMMKVEISREDEGIGIRVPSQGMWKEIIPLNEVLTLIEHLSRIENDMRYEAWLVDVQTEINKIVLVDINGLSDFCYRDAFEAHESPRETARNVLDDNSYGYDK